MTSPASTSTTTGSGPASDTDPVSKEPQRPSRERMAKWIALAAVALLAAVLVSKLTPGSWFGKPGIDLGKGPQVATGDATLLEIKKTAELKAASGSYSVPVILDPQQQSGVRKYIPDFIDGESIVAIYQGEVEAMIDLRALTSESLIVDKANNAITIRVPDPVLTKPRIDEEKSKVVSHSRGAVTRVRDAFGSDPLSGREKLDAAGVKGISDAAAQSDLKDIAKENGRTFLTALATKLGYQKVTIEYVASPN